MTPVYRGHGDDVSLRDLWPDRDDPAPPPPSRPWPYRYDRHPSQRPPSFTFWSLYLLAAAGVGLWKLLRLAPPHTTQALVVRAIWAAILVLELVLAEALWSRRSWRSRTVVVLLGLELALACAGTGRGRFVHLPGVPLVWRFVVLLPLPLIAFSAAMNRRFAHGRALD